MIERVYHCEHMGCSIHVRTATDPPHLPSGFIETRERVDGRDYVHHFCGWDCAMKYAAAQPMAESVTP